jgi:hypothetical protein
MPILLAVLKMIKNLVRLYLLDLEHPLDLAFLLVLQVLAFHLYRLYLQVLVVLLGQVLEEMKERYLKMEMPDFVLPVQHKKIFLHLENP